MLGRIGTRTDKVSGVRVTVAAPFNQNVRRMDLLALLRWTIPEAIPDFRGLSSKANRIQRVRPDVARRDYPRRNHSTFMHPDP